MPIYRVSATLEIEAPNRETATDLLAEKLYDLDSDIPGEIELRIEEV